MKTPSSRCALLVRAVLVPCIASSLLLAPAAVRAADSAPAAAKAPALPLSVTFTKAADPESGPYIMKLTNTSKAAVKVGAKILLSVAYHAENKARVVPAQSIEAGKDWSINGLAANDKVILSAEGFSNLELTVP